MADAWTKIAKPTNQGGSAWGSNDIQWGDTIATWGGGESSPQWIKINKPTT